MNVKNNVRKIVALGASAALVATTFVGALAYDLSSYPAPFIQNGMFNGAIVVGQMAKTDDMIGALDIAAKLQEKAVTPVAATGSVATTTVEGGILLEDTSNQNLNFGQVFTSTLDKYDFPSVLADGTLDDDDGSSYDYDQTIYVGAGNITFGRPNTDFADPVVYIDNSVISATTTDNLLNFSIDFDTAVNFTALDDSESIEMFGKIFTIKNVAQTDDLILYASDYSEIVTMGTPLEVEIAGVTYKIEVLTANSDANSVQLSVNGDSNSVVEGNTKTIGGIEIYVQEVFIGNIAGESASAKIFVGSEEFNLGKQATATNLKINDEVVDGVSVTIEGNMDAITEINFVVDPTDIENAELDDDYDFLQVGDQFVDPVFDFKMDFTEVVPALTEDRDLIAFTADDNFAIAFTNANGDEFTFDLYKYNNDTGIVWAEDFSNESELIKGDEFIIEESASSSKPVSIVYEFTGSSITAPVESTFRNLATGDEITVSNGSYVGKSTVTATVGATRNNVTLSAAALTNFFTESGTNISFTIPAAKTANVSGTLYTGYYAEVSAHEDAHDVYTSEVAGATYTANLTVDATDNELDISEPLSGFKSASDKTADVWYGISPYGTYGVQDDEENSYLNLYVPSPEAVFNVYLSPSNAVKVVSGATSGATSYIVNPIGNVGILDVNAGALGSKPMIVVGGPVVNTLAAELLGNPTSDEILATFEAGKAMIKFYADKNAVLVAGYEAIETQAACRVLAKYETYALAGTEMEVIATSLADIKVNPVN